MIAVFLKNSIILSLATFIGLPIFVIFAVFFFSETNILEFFSLNFLLDLLSSSFILLLGVGFLTAILGSTLAFIVVFVNFPLKNFFKIALFLPFAIPAYVLGFIYLGVFDYSGYGQEFMRNYLGITGFDLRRSSLAIITTFTLAFYPYVYMIAKSSFSRQNQSILNSAKLLGASPFKLFFKVALPLIRPAIAAGVLITLMEVLADFGLVSMFNYNTFTTAIYSAWSDFRSIETAASLSSFLMLFAVLFIFLEKKARGKSKYYSYSNSTQNLYNPQGLDKYLIMLLPIIVFLLAFLLPVLQLIIWAFAVDFQLNNYLYLLNNSLILISITVVIILIISLILTLTKKHPIIENISKIATIGYALPGSIIAVALLYLSSFLANDNIGYLLSSTIYLLVFAYVMRFIAIGYNTILASKTQIKPVFLQSAKMLGVNKFKILTKVQLPLLKTGILTAGILIAIDILKELPATYMLRPFDFDTLAIKVYELSAEGLYENAAIPAIFMIILATFLILIMQKLDKNRDTL